jgi:hypothetical protein
MIGRKLLIDTGQDVELLIISLLKAIIWALLSFLIITLYFVFPRFVVLNVQFGNFYPLC